MAKYKKFIQNNNAIAYYLFSSHSQNEASIDQQREQVHAYAKAKGFTIVREYADAAIFGTTVNRSHYQLMLSEMDMGKPQESSY